MMRTHEKTTSDEHDKDHSIHHCGTKLQKKLIPLFWGPYNCLILAQDIGEFTERHFRKKEIFLNG